MWDRYDTKNKGITILGKAPIQVEIGITIKKEQQRREYARETLQLICAYVFKKLKKHRIIGVVEPHNTASIQLLEYMELRKVCTNNLSIGTEGQTSADLNYEIINQK